MVSQMKNSLCAQGPCNPVTFEKNLSDIFQTSQINIIVLELIRTLSNLKSNANPRLVFDVMSLKLPLKREEIING